MRSLMHDVAGAALPVAIGLLVLTALARATLSEQVNDPKLRRIGRQYLNALSTWCLVAALVGVVAVALSGELTVVGVVVPAVLGVAATALREPVEDVVEARVRGVAPKPPTAAPAPTPTPVSVADGPLWAEPVEDAPVHTGLWSRS